MSVKKLKRVVIIGGGFAGIELAKSLCKKVFEVYLVDKNNYHTFQPLLYQVATSALEAEAIAYPIRKLFKGKKNLYFRLGEVTHVDTTKNIVLLGKESLEYDYLVVATGAVTNFFGNEGLSLSAMSMKSAIEALDLRSLVLQSFERALANNNPRKRQGLMNFVIAGAGPTGVELAGALGELKQKVLPKDYPELDINQMNIYLVQSGDRVLPMLSPKSSQRAQKYLEQLGVTVVLNTRVLDYHGDYVQTNTDEDIIAKTLIWTAGVKGNPIAHMNGSTTVTKGNRISVDVYNRVIGLGNVFAIGDVASMQLEDFPSGHPMVAPVAMQQGVHLARNLKNLETNQLTTPFKYKDKGAMATVGKNKAVVEIGKMKLGGVLAWFIWMAVHLMSLVGFRNKLVTFFNWTKNYFNSDRGMRLILSKGDIIEERRERVRRWRKSLIKSE
ncbi:MAG: NAD(P)/FAD-dependent oxidoreductase [Crocinitomicaceae bacterium]|nr:NAD(P)/FAD-dependent oxidoreductase [Crocinitomicaceae bacterium]